ncbi:MAG TPA: porin family protein [Alloprevotella sp.]|nr:porin family protein [Alloprevotella sp.]
MQRIIFSILVLLSLCTLTAGAQKRRVQNKPFIDERRFHYGFTFGLHDQSIRLSNNGYTDPETGRQWLAQNDNHNLGFSVGVLGEWKLCRHLALRVNPSLHFGSKHISFRDTGTGDEETQDMKSSYIAVPVDLKISAPRFNNYRPYVLAGISPMYDLTAGKHTLLRTREFNTMLELGMGCDLYLPFFKLIPELKFCIGLGNVLKKDRSDLLDPTQMVFTKSIDRATTHMVVLSFYFE